MRRRVEDQEETSSVMGNHDDVTSAGQVNDANVNSSVQYNENSTCINAIISGVIAVFYAGLIIVSILVCLYSIESLIYTSNTPVTSTTIVQQNQDFIPPVLLLMFSTGRVSKMCQCRYSYFTMGNSGDCEVGLLKSTSKDYLSIIDPEGLQEVLKVINKTSQKEEDIFMEISFLYFKGPSNWRRLEVLDVTCDLEQELDGSTTVTTGNQPIVEYLFMPSWQEFANLTESEKDDAVYHHLRDHPGMRFFPFGFENFVLISRTEIWDVESTVPSVRLQTETSLSLIDKKGFIGQKNTSKFQVEVQWKDGLVTQVKSVITATIWSSVSVVCTMMLMLEKAYGYGTRIYASIKSEREKKKINKQMRQQRELQRGSMELNINKNASSTITTKLDNCDYFSIPTSISNANNNHTPYSPAITSLDSKIENGGPCICHDNQTQNQNNFISKTSSSHSVLSSPQDLPPNTPRKSDEDYGWFSQSENQPLAPEPPLANGNCNNLLVRDKRISAINLSRLQRNLVEICSIMKESGIQFSLDNENNN